MAPDSWLEGSAPELGTRADEISAALDRLHAEAIGIAGEALGAFPPELAPSPGRDVLLERLEGIAIVDPDGGYLVWQGTPADPPGGFLDSRGPASWIERFNRVFFKQTAQNFIRRLCAQRGGVTPAGYKDTGSGQNPNVNSFHECFR